MPAFSGMVTFPAALTVTSPTAATTTISKSGLTPTWTATTGTIVVGVVQSASAGQSTSITCSYPGSAGTATIPSSALSDLVAGPAVASVTVTTTNYVMTTAGTYTVQFVAANVVYSGNLTVQP